MCCETLFTWLAFYYIFVFVSTDNTLAVTAFSGSDQPSTSMIVGAAIGGLLLGIMLVVVGLLFALHRQNGQLDLGRFGTIGGSKPRIPSSPHYLSAKQQNHYVSVGSLDWKKTSGIEDVGNGNGSMSTLGRLGGLRPPPLKISNSSVGVSTDYPTATIKRNSGGHNQMRTNIEDTNLYRWNPLRHALSTFRLFNRRDMTQSVYWLNVRYDLFSSNLVKEYITKSDHVWLFFFFCKYGYIFW